MAGGMEYEFDVIFPMADTGLIFGNDADGHLRIMDVEHESPGESHDLTRRDNDDCHLKPCALRMRISAHLCMCIRVCSHAHARGRVESV